MAASMIMPTGRKDNSGKKGISSQNKTRRQLEAAARNEEYAKLTPQQKLDRLDRGGFRAEKQRARLVQEISNQGAAK